MTEHAQVSTSFFINRDDVIGCSRALTVCGFFHEAHQTQGNISVNFCQLCQLLDLDFLYTLGENVSSCVCYTKFPLIVCPKLWPETRIGRF